MQKGLFAVAVVAVVSACASSQVSQTVNSPHQGVKVKAIAISPGAGVLGDAVAVELFNRGYTVIDPSEAARLLGRSDLGEFEMTSGASLEALQAKGVDALLGVKAAAGSDGRPQSASVRLTSTRTQQVIAAVSWQNGWGGVSGSIADRNMRKDVAEAAREIVDALQKTLR